MVHHVVPWLEPDRINAPPGFLGANAFGGFGGFGGFKDGGSGSSLRSGPLSLRRKKAFASSAILGAGPFCGPMIPGGPGSGVDVALVGGIGPDVIVMFAGDVLSWGVPGAVAGKAGEGPTPGPGPVEAVGPCMDLGGVIFGAGPVGDPGVDDGDPGPYPITAFAVFCMTDPESVDLYSVYLFVTGKDSQVKEDLLREGASVLHGVSRFLFAVQAPSSGAPTCHQSLLTVFVGCHLFV